MSGLVVQQKADDERERAEQTQEMLAAHKQAVLAGESFEHENLHETFSENFALFAAESESRNVDAKEHAMAVRDEIQEIVDQFRDRDRPCNICVFGLMGHGKSRFINLMLTALSKEPSAEAGAGGETVVAVDEVPSGDGSTTRSYTRYMMPITGSNGRFMFHVVDTIGVKFADEFRPSRQEMEQEFALVRSQLRGLDFRHRVGVIARTIPGAGPAKSAVVKGEDVMTITPEVPNAYNLAYLSDQLREKSGGWLWVPGITPSLTESQVGAAFKALGEGTATVTLRGGHTLRGVPWSFLADPDGTNWSLDPAGVYRDKRGFGQRLRHTMAAWRSYQPRCQAAILVTNPHQAVPAQVNMAWKRVFREARMAQVPLVSSHSDVGKLFGPNESAARAASAQAFIANINVNELGAERSVHFVENYYEAAEEAQERRWVSEAGALECLAAAARVAQRREQQAEELGGISEMATAFLGVTGLALMGLTARKSIRANAVSLLGRFKRVRK